MNRPPALKITSKTNIQQLVDGWLPGPEGQADPAGPQKKVKLELVGLDSNAYSLMGAFSQAARQQGWSKPEIQAVMDKARSGNYDNLLATLIQHTESPDPTGMDDEDEDEFNAHFSNNTPDNRDVEADDEDDNDRDDDYFHNYHGAGRRGRSQGNDVVYPPSNDPAPVRTGPSED